MTGRILPSMAVAFLLAGTLLCVQRVSSEEIKTSAAQPALQQVSSQDSTITRTQVEGATSESDESAISGLTDFLFTGKYLGFLLLAVLGVILLFARGINRWVRVGAMGVAFVLYGLDYIFPLHPSPICGVTQLFMFRITLGTFFPAFLAMFVAVFALSLAARKLFCGWVCPLGAFQELVNKIPFKYRTKRLNFTIFNSMRLSLLALFFLTFFFVRSQIATLAENVGADASSEMWSSFSGYSVYDPINFFELLHWQIDTVFVIMMIVLIVASLFLYRPFCYGVCPIGALTWLCEKIAPGRVRVDHDACTECMECVDASPCPTIEKLIDRKTRLAPDCYSCGECIRACDVKAIKFGFRG